MSIMAGTADGADTLSASLNGGGAAATTRGALIYAYGNEHGSFPGDARIIAGDTGDIRIFGDVVCETSTVIKADTADTADTSSLQLCGGGSGANTRGGYIVLYGNEHGTDPGEVKITPGSTGFIGLAGNTTVTGLVDINVSTTGAILTLTCTNTTAASGADINLYRDSASPAVSDFLSSIRFYGNDSAATQTQYCLIDALTTNVTDTTEAAKVRIHTMQAGASAVRLQIGAGVYHGNATGGDQGDGTLNMDAVYDDGVLLTCFPMQRPFIEQGQIDLDFWDSKAPEKHGRRHHKIAHMFADMVEDGYDPRDWRNHLSRVEGRGALPGMPEIGEWQQAKYPVGEMISRLWLALECQQLAFRSLALEHEELRRKVA